YYAHDPAIGAKRKFRESANTTVESEAKNLLKKRIGADAEGKPPVANSKVTYETLQDLLLSDYRLNHPRGLRRMTIACRHLSEMFCGVPARDITPARFNAYVKARRATMKPATVQCEIAALKRMFSLALEEEIIAHAPRLKGLAIGNSNARKGF